MHTSRPLVIVWMSIFFPIVMLVSGCNFGNGKDSTGLTVNITSPSGDLTIVQGDSVDFECSVSGGVSPYTFLWDFNGGATNSNAQNPGEVTFNDTGIFTVVLTLTDGSGVQVQASVIVSVQSTTAFSVSITLPIKDRTISVGQSVDFQCSVANGASPYTFFWDFGGGASNSAVQNPGSITFSTAGDYTVILTGTDGSGARSQNSVVIHVQ
jgi:PKD repeat protein